MSNTGREPTQILDVYHEDCDNETYHGRDEWSQSQWKKIGQPEEFYGYYVAPKEERQPFVQTPAMQFGSLVHDALLEDKEATIIPADVLSKSGARSGGEWQRWKEDHPGPAMLAKEAAIVRTLRANCQADPEVRKYLFSPAHVEYSLFGKHAATGLGIRTRFDRWLELPNANIIVDLKTTGANPTDAADIGSTCAKYGYCLQAAIYGDMATALNGKRSIFIWIFCETSFPYRVRAYKASPRYVDRGEPRHDIELGRRLNEECLAELKRRLDSDDWHGPGFGKLNEFTLPNWAYNADPLDYQEAYTEFSSYA